MDDTARTFFDKVAKTKSMAECEKSHLSDHSARGDSDDNLPQIELFEVWTLGILTEPIPGHGIHSPYPNCLCAYSRKPSLKVVKIRNATNTKKLGIRLAIPSMPVRKKTGTLLLMVSTGWQETYKSAPVSRDQVETRKSMNPDPAHWSFLPPGLL
ncbi:hypothetical protein BJ138DRAFT_1130028 [Hygrophoropsis aurantiaca]|uniref:Uncharacterized protein n=1 Tax=Hygrophoropsis aurantiaca TaxID=72124 RepID=A0ACB7ZZ84_9AGAM|nr:hypothetical protein BJ138DRAFT_1130028 [Hygrophoropsis aurantiaca]